MELRKSSFYSPPQLSSASSSNNGYTNDVLVSEDQIEKLGEYLREGPWYMHFWIPGKNEVIVVFKDKNFKIKYSDKSTWGAAIEYGKSKGIPEKQLDFSIHGQE